MRTLLTALLLPSLLSDPTSARTVQSDGGPWIVGRPAPHVHLPDVRTGEAIDLASFRGKKVLLAEFASW